MGGISLNRLKCVGEWVKISKVGRRNVPSGSLASFLK